MLLLNTNNIKLALRLPNSFNASSQRNKLIKLTHYDETKKMALDSQIARSKENNDVSMLYPTLL